MADSKRPHAFTEGAMSDARADDLARAAAGLCIGTSLSPKL